MAECSWAGTWEGTVWVRAKGTGQGYGLVCVVGTAWVRVAFFRPPTDPPSLPLFIVAVTDLHPPTYHPTYLPTYPPTHRVTIIILHTRSKKSKKKTGAVYAVNATSLQWIRTYTLLGGR